MASVISSLTSKSDVIMHVLSFLNPSELAILERTNKALQEAARRSWQDQCIIQGIILLATPDGITHRQIFKDLYPGIFGAQFYKDYLGNVGCVPPIPEKFIEMAHCPDPLGNPGETIKSNYQLMLIPAFITITVGNDSSLTLDEKGKLVKAEIRNKLPSFEKTLEIPVTLNNLAMLAKRALRRGNQTSFFKGLSWCNIFQQHGDKPVRESRWSYQKKVVVGRGQPYNEQKNFAEGARLEIVSLIERVLFNLLTYISSQNCPDDEYVVRTSTPTLDSHVPPKPWQSIVWWPTSGPSARLGLTRDNFGDNGVGVAVGVPSGSYSGH
ncbi:MAG: hypothetical protein A3C42_02395 [Chlamydiae bacterium RIFCSPHIGHO2_02_FULL_45_9]|nr:MAG: hypothetical protein A3C42_02395 [Chlamydiae bacterium RIFCSPHIGHO2_02_FULL_45_9]